MSIVQFKWSLPTSAQITLAFVDAESGGGCIRSLLHVEIQIFTTLRQLQTSDGWGCVPSILELRA